MTWVVGSTTMFGYGIVVSDICVSWKRSDGSYYTKDCLQKVYPISRSMIAGFSGSVKLGFILLQDLANFLRLSENDKDIDWKPEWVANKWWRRARRIYSKQTKEMQENGVSIVLVGAHPRADNGMPGKAKIYISVFKSPNFNPTVDCKFNTIHTIGMGSKIQEYKKIIEDLTKDGSYNELMQMETSNLGGYALAFASLIGSKIYERPTKGVSKNIHVALVKRNGYKISSLNTTEYGGTRIDRNMGTTLLTIPINKKSEQIKKTKKVECKMPKVAKGYMEFEEMVGNIHRKAEAAIC